MELRQLANEPGSIDEAMATALNSNYRLYFPFSNLIELGVNLTKTNGHRNFRAPILRKPKEVLK